MGGRSVEVLAACEVDLLVVVLQSRGPGHGLVAILVVTLEPVLILVLVFGPRWLRAPRQLLENLSGFGTISGTFGQNFLQTDAAGRGRRRGRR